MSILKKIFTTFLTVVIALCVGAGGMFVYTKFFSNKEPTLTVTEIEQKISGISELSTAKLTYRGIVRYEDGEIAFINKKSFNMIYSAEVKAGVDVSLIDITVNDTSKIVKLTLPAIEVYSPTIDPDSIEFYDQKNSLFNRDGVEDISELLNKAEAEVLASSDVENLKQTAKQQLELLIKGLLSDYIQDYTLEINYK